jgi:hypothetical protein
MRVWPSDFTQCRQEASVSFTVFFTVNGFERTLSVVTRNANFAREAVEAAHPKARVTMILPGKVR